jgi:predicted dehydrogenase
MKTRLGSIGLGWWGNELASAATRTGTAEIVTCFAPPPEERAAFVARHGCGEVSELDDLLSDPDIDGVLIATPHSTHVDLIEQAAAAGKHVYTEKPFTLTVADADRGIAACNAAGTVLQVGHNRRRLPANRIIKAMMDRGELGEILFFEATHNFPVIFKEVLGWRANPKELPAGGMTNLGIHQVDSFHYLTGPVARVSALSKRVFTTGDIDDTTTINFEFESGALGHLLTVTASGPVADLTVHGTEGSAWNLDDGARLLTGRRGSPDRVDVELEPLDTVVDELAEFAAAIQGEATPEVGGAEGREVVAVLEATVASIERNRPVEVDEFR